MNIDKMRDQFEKFRDERNAQLEREGHKPGSKWHVTNAHYATWQASRKSLVVELPIDVTGGHYRLAVESCKRCIEAAGLKVKS